MTIRLLNVSRNSRRIVGVSTSRHFSAVSTGMCTTAVAHVGKLCNARAIFASLQWGEWGHVPLHPETLCGTKFTTGSSADQASGRPASGQIKLGQFNCVRDVSGMPRAIRGAGFDAASQRSSRAALRWAGGCVR